VHPSERFVLGLVPSARLRERDPRVRAFVRALGERTGLYVVERSVSTYDELEREMTLAHIHIAWLPPLLFARLERDAVAVALATRVEDRDTYASVLVVRAESPIASLDQLARSRIAWVDPLSAAGYVVPRLGLLARGIDLRTTFAHEFFAGSHAEALRALLEDRADVIATFAHFDGTGQGDANARPVHGPWSELGVSPDALRILAVLGEIPLDLVAARASVPEDVRQTLARALVEMSTDPELGPTVEAVFGCRRLAQGASTSYEALRELLARASDPKLGWLSESFASTAPPERTSSSTRSSR
jgi:phosphonate transport system substrate-binding protein